MRESRNEDAPLVQSLSRSLFFRSFLVYSALQQSCQGRGGGVVCTPVPSEKGNNFTSNNKDRV